MTAVLVNPYRYAAGVSIAHIAHASAAYTGPSTGATTSAIDTTTADFIVIGIQFYGLLGVPVVSDNQGNTWTARTQFDNTSQDPSIQLYYCVPTTKNASHTFSLAGNTVYGRIEVIAFSGVKQTAPYDTETHTVSASTAPIASGAVTPAVNGSLLISMVGINADGLSFSGSPAFTVTGNHDAVSGENWTFAIAYYVQPTAGSINSEWTPSVATGVDGVASLTAFKPA